MIRASILAVALGTLLLSAAAPESSEMAGGKPTRVVVYVTGQELYYDSVIVADPVPPIGPFQLLEMGEHGLETEFGKGDQGYLGGRWKEDFDGDGVYHYFVCPLLGKGRPTP